jgi:hypothetical protein
MHYIVNYIISLKIAEQKLQEKDKKLPAAVYSLNLLCKTKYFTSLLIPGISLTLAIWLLNKFNWLSISYKNG